MNENKIAFVEAAQQNGLFGLEMTIGNVSNQIDVPALPSDYGNFNAYIIEQLKSGVLLVAFRYGDKGMCGFRLNSDLLLGPNDYPKAMITRYLVDNRQTKLNACPTLPRDFFKVGVIEPTTILPEYAEISTFTTQGDRFEASIHFKPPA